MLCLGPAFRTNHVIVVQRRAAKNGKKFEFFMGQISVAKILPKLRAEDNQNVMTRKKEKMKSYDKK